MRWQGKKQCGFRSGILGGREREGLPFVRDGGGAVLLDVLGERQGVNMQG